MLSLKNVLLCSVITFWLDAATSVPMTEAARANRWPVLSQTAQVQYSAVNNGAGLLPYSHALYAQREGLTAVKSGNLAKQQPEAIGSDSRTWLAQPTYEQLYKLGTNALQWLAQRAVKTMFQGSREAGSNSLEDERSQAQRQPVNSSSTNTRKKSRHRLLGRHLKDFDACVCDDTSEQTDRTSTSDLFSLPAAAAIASEAEHPNRDDSQLLLLKVNVLPTPAQKLLKGLSIGIKGSTDWTAAFIHDTTEAAAAQLQVLPSQVHVALQTSLAAGLELPLGSTSRKQAASQAVAQFFEEATDSTSLLVGVNMVRPSGSAKGGLHDNVIALATLTGLDNFAAMLAAAMSMQQVCPQLFTRGAHINKPEDTRSADGSSISTSSDDGSSSSINCWKLLSQLYMPVVTDRGGNTTIEGKAAPAGGFTSALWADGNVDNSSEEESTHERKPAAADESATISVLDNSSKSMDSSSDSSGSESRASADSHAAAAAAAHTATTGVLGSASNAVTDRSGSSSSASDRHDPSCNGSSNDHIAGDSGSGNQDSFAATVVLPIEVNIKVVITVSVTDSQAPEHLVASAQAWLQAKAIDQVLQHYGLRVGAGAPAHLVTVMSPGGLLMPAAGLDPGILRPMLNHYSHSADYNVSSGGATTHSSAGSVAVGGAVSGGWYHESAVSHTATAAVAAAAAPTAQVNSEGTSTGTASTPSSISTVGTTAALEHVEDVDSSTQVNSSSSSSKGSSFIGVVVGTVVASAVIGAGMALVLVSLIKQRRAAAAGVTGGSSGGRTKRHKRPRNRSRGVHKRHTKYLPSTWTPSNIAALSQTPRGSAAAAPARLALLPAEPVSGPQGMPIAAATDPPGSTFDNSSRTDGAAERLAGHALARTSGNAVAAGCIMQHASAGSSEQYPTVPSCAHVWLQALHRSTSSAASDERAARLSSCPAGQGGPGNMRAGQANNWQQSPQLTSQGTWPAPAATPVRALSTDPGEADAERVHDVGNAPEPWMPRFRRWQESRYPATEATNAGVAAAAAAAAATSSNQNSDDAVVLVQPIWPSNLRAELCSDSVSSAARLDLSAQHTVGSVARVTTEQAGSDALSSASDISSRNSSRASSRCSNIGSLGMSSSRRLEHLAVHINIQPAAVQYSLASQHGIDDHSCSTSPNSTGVRPMLELPSAGTSIQPMGQGDRSYHAAAGDSSSVAASAPACPATEWYPAAGTSWRSSTVPDMNINATAAAAPAAQTGFPASSMGHCLPGGVIAVAAAAHDGPVGSSDASPGNGQHRLLQQLVSNQAVAIARPSALLHSPFAVHYNFSALQGLEN